MDGGVHAGPFAPPLTPGLDGGGEQAGCVAAAREALRTVTERGFDNDWAMDRSAHLRQPEEGDWRGLGAGAGDRGEGVRRLRADLRATAGKLELKPGLVAGGGARRRSGGSPSYRSGAGGSRRLRWTPRWDGTVSCWASRRASG